MAHFIDFLNFLLSLLTTQELQLKPTQEEKEREKRQIAIHFLTAIAEWRKMFGNVPDAFYPWMDAVGHNYPIIMSGFTYARLTNDSTSSHEVRSFIECLQLIPDPQGKLPSGPLATVLLDPRGVDELNRLYISILEYKAAHPEQR